MGCAPELLKKEALPAAIRKFDLPEGVPPLTSLYMYIAGSCNLACRHCWISPTYEPDNSKGQFLKLEYVKKAVREAKPLGLQSVKLTGGEPMLHPQFREIVEHINNKGIEIIIETNGTLIDSDLANFLKSKPYMRFLSVSLDGANEKTHDALRGIPGSFKRSLSGLKSLVKVGFKPQMICTLHRGNVSEINKIIDFAKLIGCGSIKFNRIQQLGRGEKFNTDQSLQLNEIFSVFNHIEKKIKPKSKIPIFFDMPPVFYPLSKLLKEPLSKCAIHSILGVLADGEIAMCGIGESIPDLVFGHLQKDTLKRIWIQNQKLKQLRRDIPDKLEGICGECSFNSFCQGNCIALNYHMSGKINSSYVFCEQANAYGLFPPTRKQSKGELNV
jgi:SynChlorMet cassette radical SAM/SPASM protein ScmF